MFTRALSNRLARHEPLLFALTILLHLAPIWAFKYLPTTDGAAHVANADVLRKYNDPALDVFRKYYYISRDPSPNLAGHLILAGLLYIAPPTAAEKILVSLYLVLFPQAARYAVRAFHRRATPLSWLAFPLTYSFLLHQGFYNFCLSLAGFLFVVGYWVRNKHRIVGRRAFALGALALLLYTCHLFSLMMACGVIAALAGWEWILEWRQSGRLLGPVAKRAIVTAAAMIPPIILALIFRPHADPDALPKVDPWTFSQLKDDLISLFQFSTLTSFRDEEHWLGGAVFTLVAALAGWALLTKTRRRHWTPRDILLPIPFALAAVFLIANDPKSIYFYVPQRALFYAFLIALLWLAAQPITRRVRALVPPFALAVALAFLASAALKYREFAPQIREFVDVAGGHIAPNSTFLPLIFSPQGRDDRGKPSATEVAPFYMISGYVAAQRNAVDLRNYEAKTDHFPVRFRPDLNPYEHLAIGQGLDRIPPVIDIQNFRKQGGQIDYIIIWAIPEELRDHEGTLALHNQLKSAGYIQIPLAGATRTELWKRLSPSPVLGRGPG